MSELGAVVYKEFSAENRDSLDENASYDRNVDEKLGVLKNTEIESEKLPGHAGPQELAPYIESEQSTESKEHRAPLWRRILGDGHKETQKTLKPRHISFLALGGSIGTGLFFSTGATVAQAGPGGALVIYGITAVFVLSVVACLTEMTSYIPHSGAFQHYAERFVSPAFGFSVGINYYLQWALSIPSELSACTFIIAFWDQTPPSWVWIFPVLFPVVLLQFMNVKWYGEVEYWNSAVKIALIIAYIVTALVWAFNGIATASEKGPGLSNFHDGLNFKGGFPGLFAGGYAFYSFGGTEMVALTAGETKKPYKYIPAAAKMTFYRIVILMMLTVFVISLTVNANDPNLLQASDNSDVTVSPITLVFKWAGFKAADQLINAILLIVIISALNACFYASSRMLMAMAQNRMLPSVFSWTNGWGVPVLAEICTAALGSLTFIAAAFPTSTVFTWFMNVTACSAILTWTSIGVLSLRFRLALRRQGIPDSDLPFRQYLFPLLPVIVIVLGLFLFAAEIYGSCPTGSCNWTDPFGTLLGCIVWFVCWIGWKVIFWKTDRVKSLDEIDVTTGAVWPVGTGKQRMAEERAATYYRRYRGRGTFLGRLKWWLYHLESPIEARRQSRCFTEGKPDIENAYAK